MDSSAKTPSQGLNELDLDTVSRMPTGGSGNPVADEIKRLGKTALSQMFGGSTQKGAPVSSDADIKKMKEEDDQFSEKEYLELRRKIQAIYDEYSAQRAREKEEKKQEEEEKKARQLERLYEMRKGPIGADVKTAVSKGSAETGRNWGAE